MYFKLFGSKVSFVNNISGVVVPDTPVEPDVPVDPSVPDVMPEEYATFLSSYARSSMSEDQKKATYTMLYKLNDAGLMAKIRQLYLPCVMPDWDHCFLNVASYFNKTKEEYTKIDLYSNSTLGRCFDVCDYGLYRTNANIGWGDCLVSTWADEDVKANDWHILLFKPAQQDATTVVHSGGLNFRSRSGASVPVNFSIGGNASATQRVRGGWANGTLNGVTMKNTLFTEPTGWGNGTHDPYCVGISIKNDRMVTPSSNYQEFGYNNRNLVDEITEWPLIEGQTLPDTAMKGVYGWGGYQGVSISTQQSLATSVVSIGLGLTKDELQAYLDVMNEFMEGMGIKNDNWDPDNLS